MMLVNSITPNVSAAKYSLLREEVGTNLYDIVRKYLSRCQAGSKQE